VPEVAQLLRLRIVLLDPPTGVKWALQLGQAELVAPTSSRSARTSFELEVEAVRAGGAESPRLRGPAVQGRPGGRFVYINSGTYAGQPASEWSRRAKVSLEGITWSLIEAATAKRNGALEAQLVGTASDGGPACASVPLLGTGWKIV
jgi:hypothetical protein